MDNKHEMDENDPLKEYYREIAHGMNPPPKLVNKVKGGVTVKLFPKSVHVKRFVQAAACYVIGVALLLSAVILLPRLWERGAPVGTQPPEPAGTTTVFIGEAPNPMDERDILTKSDLTDLQKELYHAVWEYRKDDLPESYTINHLSFRPWILKIRDLYICFPKQEVGYAVTTVCVEGYAFVYNDTAQLQVFAHGEFHTLQSAYDVGILSIDDIRTIWLAYSKVGELTLVNDRIRKDSITSFGFAPRNEEKDTAQKLFDGILTEDGQITGKVEPNACFFFDFDQPIRLSAYAIVNGSEADSPEVSRPNQWFVFATNDPNAAAEARQSKESLWNLWFSGDLILLDYGAFDDLSAENNRKNYNYFSVKGEAKGEYQYYCWYVEGDLEGSPKGFQAAELELYTASGQVN